MKAISIRQPYAFAVTNGYKPVENRSWRTSYRGPLLVHTSLVEETTAVPDVLFLIADQTGESVDKVAAAYRNNRRLGEIVGAVKLVDCVSKHDSPWFTGPWGFVFEDPLPAKTFFRIRGQLGLFELPDNIVQDLDIPPYTDAEGAA